MNSLQNLFTTRYLPIPVQQAGWQNFRPHYMGYGMQYYSNAAVCNQLIIELTYIIYWSQPF